MKTFRERPPERWEATTRPYASPPTSSSAPVDPGPAIPLETGEASSFRRGDLVVEDDTWDGPAPETPPEVAAIADSLSAGGEEAPTLPLARSLVPPLRPAPSGLPGSPAVPLAGGERKPSQVSAGGPPPRRTAAPAAGGRPSPTERVRALSSAIADEVTKEEWAPEPSVEEREVLQAPPLGGEGSAPHNLPPSAILVSVPRAPVHEVPLGGEAGGAQGSPGGIAELAPISHRPGPSARRYGVATKDKAGGGPRGKTLWVLVVASVVTIAGIILAGLLLWRR